jgi:hypothetical protein
MSKRDLSMEMKPAGFGSHAFKVQPGVSLVEFTAFFAEKIQKLYESEGVKTEAAYSVDSINGKTDRPNMVLQIYTAGKPKDTLSVYRMYPLGPSNENTAIFSVDYSAGGTDMLSKYIEQFL